jgi:hypothetical protein
MRQTEKVGPQEPFHVRFASSIYAPYVPRFAPKFIVFLFERKQLPFLREFPRKSRKLLS